MTTKRSTAIMDMRIKKATLGRCPYALCISTDVCIDYFDRHQLYHIFKIKPMSLNKAGIEGTYYPGFLLTPVPFA